MSTSSKPAGDLPAGANAVSREERFRNIAVELFKAHDALQRASDGLMDDLPSYVNWDYVHHQLVRVIDATCAAQVEILQLAVIDDDDVDTAIVPAAENRPATEGGGM